jgi:hypothetical protein
MLTGPLMVFPVASTGTADDGVAVEFDLGGGQKLTLDLGHRLEQFKVPKII